MDHLYGVIWFYLFSLWFLRDSSSSAVFTSFLYPLQALQPEDGKAKAQKKAYGRVTTVNGRELKPVGLTSNYKPAVNLYKITLHTEKCSKSPPTKKEHQPFLSPKKPAAAPQIWGLRGTGPAFRGHLTGISYGPSWDHWGIQAQRGCFCSCCYCRCRRRRCLLLFVVVCLFAFCFCFCCFCFCCCCFQQILILDGFFLFEHTQYLSDTHWKIHMQKTQPIQASSTKTKRNYQTTNNPLQENCNTKTTKTREIQTKHRRL